MQQCAVFVIPDFLTFTDIKGIYKLRGEKSIIEKLVYKVTYETIDNQMSYSNVGGRRSRNIRDNLFVIYATIIEAIRNKKDINIQFYDLTSVLMLCGWKKP